MNSSPYDAPLDSGYISGFNNALKLAEDQIQDMFLNTVGGESCINPAYVESLQKECDFWRELAEWARTLLCSATPNHKVLSEEQQKEWCAGFGKWFAESHNPPSKQI